MKKFRNKYRIQSSRLKNWDYASSASYFVTICTKNREHFFGNSVYDKINNEPKIELNEIGNIVDNFWLQIPQHFNYVKLAEHIVMPNHIHGIITIDQSKIEFDFKNHHPEINIIKSQAENQLKKLNKMSVISPRSGSISTILRSFKSAVTKNAHLINPNFEWQERFHDYVIPDEKTFKKIQAYIINNPINWKDDRFYS